MLLELLISLLGNLSLISMNILVTANFCEYFIFFLSLKDRKIMAEAIYDIPNNKTSEFWYDTILIAHTFFSVLLSFTITGLCTKPIYSQNL